MKNSVSVTIKTRENSIRVENSKGKYWLFEYEGDNTGKTAAATIAAAMLTATIQQYLDYLQVNGDEWKFTLSYETGKEVLS